MNKLNGILNWTWGIIQTSVGAIVWCILRYIHPFQAKYFMYHGQPVVLIPGNWGGISIGWFTFVDSLELDLIRHEHGHTIQSMIFGPFWILIFGIPSLIWAGFFERYRIKNNISYYAFYTERLANYFGKVNK